MELRGVGFRYGGPEAPPILRGISLEVPAGRSIAIVGRSGSGKTTLIKCLAGLLEPTEGTVLFDGVDMRTLDYRDLRRHIGVVLQQNYMFDGTILGNIAFGDPEPQRERAVWAAKLANAHDFIRQLPLGYETRIGESGLLLSGGQQQRIGIARALYIDPPDPDLRRGHQRAGHGVGARDPGEHGPPALGAHDVHHRPPAEHHPARRPHRGGREGTRSPSGEPTTS